jgi:hypothetical protein
MRFLLLFIRSEYPASIMASATEATQHDTSHVVLSMTPYPEQTPSLAARAEVGKET